MGDPTETILNLVIVGVALFAGGTILLPMLSNLAAQTAAGAGATTATTPVTTTTTTTDANGNVVTTPTTPAPLPTNTGNPITDLLNSITNATQAVNPPAVLPTVNTGADAGLCKSKYFGKCDTECKGGNSSNCTNCRIACGLSSNVATIDDVYSYAGMPMPVGYHVTFA